MMPPATLRLAWIESRRSAGLWCAPFLVLLAWFAAQQETVPGVTLWTVTSQQIASALILIAPAGGGLAAWAAGRDRRRGIEDLLRTTPRPSVHRDLAGFAASVAWVLLACLVVGGVLWFGAVRDATWGGPLLGPIGVGVLTLLAAAAVGFVAGALIPGRFTAPLVAVGVFICLAAPTAAPYQRSPETGFLVPSTVHYLTPLAITEEVAYPVFVEPWPDIAGGQAILLAGIAAAALCGLALRRRRTPLAWAGLAAAVGVAGLGVASLMAVELRVGEAILYTPACTQRPGSVEVCLHPAYAAALDQTADVVDAVVAPLIGIPGAPGRIEQAPDLGRDGSERVPSPAGTLATLPLDVGASDTVTAQIVALDVVLATPVRGSELVALGEAQAAIATWLVDRAGFGDGLRNGPIGSLLAGTAPPGTDAGSPGHRQDAVDAAVARFAALDPAAQRAWLEAHWDALRAGALTLDDLP